MNAHNTQTVRGTIFANVDTSAQTMPTRSNALAVTAGVSPEFALVLAKYEETVNAADHYNETVMYPAIDRYAAAIEAVPHISFVGSATLGGQPVTYSTGDRIQVALAKGMKDKPSFKGPVIQDQRRLLAALEDRKRALDVVARETDYEAVNAESDRLGNACSEATDAVARFPVESLVDLNVKMGVLVNADFFACEGTDKLVAADIARIAARFVPGKA